MPKTTVTRDLLDSLKSGECRVLKQDYEIEVSTDPESLEITFSLDAEQITELSGKVYDLTDRKEALEALLISAQTGTAPGLIEAIEVIQNFQTQISDTCKIVLDQREQKKKGWVILFDGVKYKMTVNNITRLEYTLSILRMFT